jgi:O-antigen/teichoic acid export membrane protein
MLTGVRHRRTATAALTARGVVQGVVGRGLNFVFAYLATVLLARRLGPAAYGVYGVVISVLIWIEQTARFTVPPAAAKLIPEDRIRSPLVQQTALFLGSILFASLFVVLWTAAGPLAALFGLSHTGVALFRTAALDLPLFGLYAIYRGVLQGRHDFLSLAIADALYAAAKLAAVILLLGLWLSVASALVANVLASLAALVFVMSRGSIPLRRPSSAVVSPLIRLALPLGLYMLALQTITHLDLWALTALDAGRDAGTLGLYVAARNVAIVPGVVLMVVSDVLLPSLSRAIAADDARVAPTYIRAAVRFLAILVVPIVLVLAVGADDIMGLLYSGEFRTGGGYLRALLVYAALLPFMDLFASVLSARGEPYRGGTTLAVVIPAAVALNLLLIPRYGPMGAAYASGLAGLAGTAALGVQVFRRCGAFVAGRTFLNIVLASGAAVMIARQLAIRAWHPFVVCGAGLTVYAAVLLVLRELRQEDVEPLAFWKWSGERGLPGDL